MDNVLELLSTVRLFEELSTEELSQIVKKSELRTFPEGEHVIRYGESGRFLGVLIEGEVEVTSLDEGGERQLLAIMKTGDIIGEMSLLTGEPSCADVTASESTVILLIPNKICFSQLSTNSNAVMLLVRTITDRLRKRKIDDETGRRVEGAWNAASDRYGLALSSSTPAKILVINCGSSSLKFSYFDTVDSSKNAEGGVERIGEENGRLETSTAKGKNKRELGPVTHEDAFETVIEFLTESEEEFISDMNELTAVGHRVVHGGSKYSSPVVINEDVIETIEELCSLAPLHNPPNLAAIRKSVALMPNIPQVAVFDTAFHQKMPKHAYLYGVPYKYYEEDGIRRFGFHGISHHYLALRAASHLKVGYRDLKIISCHLGNGASICAINHGRSIDTSMGLTPLEGLVMGTRCGDIDPGALVHIARKEGMSPDELDTMLNKESGVKGLSGLTNDFRELEDAAGAGNRMALMALHVYCYRIRKYIGAYLAAMGGVDVIVFAGGVGEYSPWVRGLACQGLGEIGISIDDIKSRAIKRGEDKLVDISAEDSRAKILVIPTDEGRMIARETIRTLGYHSKGEVIRNLEDRSIPIRISIHHVHLSGEDAAALFGEGAELTYLRKHSQPNQFAAKETVDVEGPRGTLKNIHVYGPYRKQSQVEISHSDETALGIKAPIRRSGDIKGSPGVLLRGNAGEHKISCGVIRFHRHIHMTPGDALTFGLKNGDRVMVKIEGERALIFDNVLVRIDPDFELSMHIDIDEANAADITEESIGELIGVHGQK